MNQSDCLYANFSRGRLSAALQEASEWMKSNEEYITVWDVTSYSVKDQDGTWWNITIYYVEKS